MAAVDDYYEALSRLIANNPERIEKGSEINKDTVALEAGRKRGSLRKRPEFEQLIEDIEKAAEKSIRLKHGSSNRFQRNAENLKLKLEKAINDKDIAQSRYMSLIYQNHMLKKQLHENNIEPKIFGEVLDLDLDS